MEPPFQPVSGVVLRVKWCRALREPFVGRSGALIRAPGARRRFWRGHGSFASVLDFHSGRNAPVTGGASSADWTAASRRRLPFSKLEPAGSTAPPICCHQGESSPPTRNSGSRDQAVEPPIEGPRASRSACGAGSGAGPGPVDDGAGGLPGSIQAGELGVATWKAVSREQGVELGSRAWSPDPGLVKGIGDDPRVPVRSGWTLGPGVGPGPRGWWDTSPMAGF
jgi:hypothetical protein